LISEWQFSRTKINSAEASRNPTATKKNAAASFSAEEKQKKKAFVSLSNDIQESAILTLSEKKERSVTARDAGRTEKTIPSSSLSG